eukprot:comp22955_c0_seq1/m.36435 comp22955_c0_seq1/g.36435  ORF comp22955_c0_seq1/g.36435 comp22955_c0_seq1/m.36435 type:complete len:314 (-) comp22955_c0_seq1:153-1094(-)
MPCCSHTTTVVAATANSHHHRTKPRRRLGVKEVPPHATLPHILHGYPKLESTWDCFKSLFWIHNETVNQWTHLIGFCMMVYLLFLTGEEMSLKAHPIEDRAAFLTFFVCTCTCFLLSTFYHTFKCYTYAVYRVAVTMDYMGIFVMICGSFISGLHFEFYCTPGWRTVYQVGITIMCIAGMVLAFMPMFDSPSCSKLRVGSYFAIVGSALVPLVHVMIGFGVERILKWGALLLLYACGAVAYMTKFPESVFPGKFDIWLSSHQLWHTFVLLAAFWHYYTLLQLQNEVTTTTCHAYAYPPTTPNDLLSALKHTSL